MTSKMVRLVRSLCLSLAFVITMFSLAAEHGARAGLPVAHMVSGTLLLLGSMAHMRSNREWVQTVMKRGWAGMPRRVRFLFVTDSVLLISAGVCALTAIPAMAGVLGPAMAIAGHVHAVSGAVMAVALFTHLLQHWGWLVSTLRGLWKTGARRPTTVSR